MDPPLYRKFGSQLNLPHGILTAKYNEEITKSNNSVKQKMRPESYGVHSCVCKSASKRHQKSADYQQAGMEWKCYKRKYKADV